MEQAEQQTEMQKKISDYQEILLTFAELLQEENQALRDYNVVRVSEMYEQKARLFQFTEIWWLILSKTSMPCPPWTTRPKLR